MNQAIKQSLGIALSITAILATVALTFASPAQATTPNWDTTGDYVVAMEYQGSDYTHDVALTQDAAGQLTGSGGSPAGSNIYLWAITSGAVTSDSIEFIADYSATPDAVDPQTTITVIGTIAADGSMTGTWSDNYSGSDRTGTWVTVSGVATELPTATLSAEDFGVVSYDTGTGLLAGYSAGFAVSGDTLAGAQAVVVELFAGDTLLQTNTAIIPAFNAAVTGTQFSSPFDVSGAFNYSTDGFWVNERESQFGQSTAATKVVATVTLADETIITATNTTRSGDPATIFETSDSQTVTVTIEKFVQGALATAATANNADFPMTATWNAANTGAGTDSYTLGDTSTIPYQAITAPMAKGADYETKELVSGDVVGAQCATGKPFALLGYTAGNSRAAAMAATPSMAMPSFTNLQQDKFVIVWNRDCDSTEGQLGGEVVGTDGILEVTAIEMIDTTATANGTFEDGWTYIFHITAPMSEENLSMKFSDWVQTGGAGVLPVANNMRISSLQADNGGATILLTGANTYATPDLTMISDLDPAMDGRQVEITVTVAVPIGTNNGTYTTTYGVRSN